MKKKMYIFIIIAVIIIFSLSLMYQIDMGQIKNNKPVIFSRWGYDYVPLINLDEEQIINVIHDYIINQDEINKKGNEKYFTSLKVFAISEKKDITEVYAWVLGESYYKENDEIHLDSGYSIPHKFILTKKDEIYNVSGHQIPRDGKYYAIDLKEMFPGYVLTYIDDVHTNGTIEKLSLEIEKKVNEYFKENK